MKTLATPVAAVLSAGLLLAGCTSEPPSTAPTASEAGTSAPSGMAASSTAVKRVGVEQFDSAVQTPGTVVVDVRTPEEFASGHLAGAVNIDLAGRDFAGQVAQLDPEKVYAVYCRSGNRSQEAAAQMAAAGIQDIYELDGGISDWAAAGKPVVQ